MNNTKIKLRSASTLTKIMETAPAAQTFGSAMRTMSTKDILAPHIFLPNIYGESFLGHSND